MLHGSRGDGSLCSWGGMEVLARCVGIGGVDRVARLDTKVGELQLDLIGDSHDGNR